MQGYKLGGVAAADGVRLSYRIYAPSHQDPPILPVVCLAGLTRNARDFHDIATIIASDPIRPRQVVCLDYRGRGNSDRANDAATYNVLTEAQDSLRVLDELQIQRAIFIGTSRGGLILHVLAQLSPDRIAALVLNDVGPELAPLGLAEIQAYLNKGETKPLSDWKSAEHHLVKTHGQAFPALTEADWTEWAKAVLIEEAGQIVPDCDPAIAAAFVKLDLSQPLPDLWQQFELLTTKPMLVIRGENSSLLTDAIVAKMAEKHPSLQAVLAAGQGHAPLLHKHPVCEQLLSYLRNQYG